LKKINFSWLKRGKLTMFGSTGINYPWKLFLFNLSWLIIKKAKLSNLSLTFGKWIEIWEQNLVWTFVWPHWVFMPTIISLYLSRFRKRRKFVLKKFQHFIRSTQNFLIFQPMRKQQNQDRSVQKRFYGFSLWRGWSNQIIEAQPHR